MIADLKAMGERIELIAERVGTTIRTVERVLADQAAAGRAESCRLTEKQESDFAWAMAGRSFQDVLLRKPVPMYAPGRLPPGR